MKKAFLLFTVIFILNCNSVSGNSNPVINNAKIDFLSHDFNKSGPVKLDGSWEFYWLRLYTSDDFKKNNIEIKRYAKIPGLWNNKTSISDGSEFPELGHATYRLNLSLKKETSYAVKLQEMNCAYRLYIDGRLVSGNGIVADNPEEMKPQYLPRYAIFTPEKDNTEIILQISNYSYYNGGSPHSILIGTDSQIIKKRNIELIKDLAVFGIIFIIGLYHFLIYFIRRRDLSLLFYSIGSISLALRLSFQREMFFSIIYPGLNWDIFILMSHVFSYIAGLSLILFLWAMFKIDIKRIFIYAHIVITSSYLIMMLFTRPAIFSSLQTPFLIFYMLSLFYFFIVLITIVKNKRKFSLIMLSVFIIMTVSIINDQLFYLGLINTGYIISFGMIFFIFSQAIILALKYKYAYEKIENLSIQIMDENKKIEMINLELEEKVLKRTEVINRQKAILDDQIFMAKKIQKTIIPEKAPRISGFDISFINRPMIQIGGDFIDFIVKNDKEAGVFICDVSGQGVPGAMIASMVKIALIHQWRENISRPGLILKNIHESISLNLGGNFITAVAGYINSETGRFIFSNAGHPPLLYINNNNEIKDIKSEGKPIFRYFKSDFEELSIDLKAGEKIFLYSDGLLEVTDIKNNSYNTEMLKKLIEQKNNLDIEKLCNSIINDVTRFSSGNPSLNDDVTLLALEFKGLSDKG